MKLIKVVECRVMLLVFNKLLELDGVDDDGI